ncbi:MAG: type II secretion system secretin GspD [Pseudomonadota bacterium]
MKSLSSYMRLICTLAGLIWCLPIPAYAQQTLNLREADIRAVVQEVSRSTGRTFIVDPDVKGTITIISEVPLSQGEYFEAFLAALRANGFSAVPAAGIPGGFRVVKAQKARGGAGAIGANALTTEVVPLRFVDAETALNALSPLASDNGQIIASRAGNAIILVEYADAIAQLKKVLRGIDRDNRTMQVVSLENMSARDMVTTLTALQGDVRTGQVPLSIVPVAGTNGLVLRGDAASVKALSKIAKDLDERAQISGDVRVVYLEHADADQILPVLQQMVGQVAAVAAPAGDDGAQARARPVEAGRPTIARFEGANALVVSAPANLQRAIMDIVEQLDKRRAQVMVEALIVEISDGAARNLGVQFLLGGTGDSVIPLAATNYSNTQPNLLAIAGAVGANELDTTETTIDGGIVRTTNNSPARNAVEQAAVSSLLGVSGGLLGVGGEIGDNALFGAIINAIQSDSASNMLSTPSIMTLDNQQARILVGQEIPITTGEALANTFENAFRTVERQNVGIQLEVRPQINKGGEITLFLRQEVSSIAGPVSDDFNDLILNKREVETTITVDDGQIVALGGLLEESERRSMERIPFLSSIPLLGVLFKSRARTRARTNLMIFIRPTVVTSKEDAEALSGRRMDQVRLDMRARGLKSEYSLDALVREYMGAALPSERGLELPPPEEKQPEEKQPEEKQ